MRQLNEKHTLTKLQSYVTIKVKEGFSLTTQKNYSYFKNRHKGFLFLEFILLIITTFLFIYSLIWWREYLSYFTYTIFLLAGIIYVLRGIESKITKVRPYKFTIIFGIVLILIAIGLLIFTTP